jgi:hypothetical protein
MHTRRTLLTVVALALVHAQGWAQGSPQGSAEGWAQGWPGDSAGAGPNAYNSRVIQESDPWPNRRSLPSTVVVF